MIIPIPLCCLPNTLYQTIDTDKCRRSLYQINQLQRIAEHTHFAYFVVNGNNEIVDPNYTSAFTVLWYDRFGALHAVHLGRKKILAVHRTPNGTTKPLPITDHVYKVRCKHD